MTYCWWELFWCLTHSKAWLHKLRHATKAFVFGPSKSHSCEEPNIKKWHIANKNSLLVLTYREALLLHQSANSFYNHFSITLAICCNGKSLSGHGFPQVDLSLQNTLGMVPEPFPHLYWPTFLQIAKRNVAVFTKHAYFTHIDADTCYSQTNAGFSFSMSKKKKKICRLRMEQLKSKPNSTKQKSES